MMLQQGLRFKTVDNLNIRLNTVNEIVLDVGDGTDAVCIVIEVNDTTRPLMLAWGKQVEKIMKRLESPDNA